jgi:hypothetical protein
MDAEQPAEPDPSPSLERRWLGLPVREWILATVLVFAVALAGAVLRLAGYLPGTGPIRAVSTNSLVVALVFAALLASFAMFLPLAYRLLTGYEPVAPERA